MAKPYSQDLRDRVIDAVQRRDRRGAARHYAISKSVAFWAQDCLILADGGSVRAQPQTSRHVSTVYHLQTITVTPPTAVARGPSQQQNRRPQERLANRVAQRRRQDAIRQ